MFLKKKLYLCFLKVKDIELMPNFKYEVFLPKSKEQLESFIYRISKKNPVKHYIIRIFPEYIERENFLKVLENFQDQIKQFKKNKSLVFWTTEDEENLPSYISIAPTEEEALDIIDFEEIERDLLS